MEKARLEDRSEKTSQEPGFVGGLDGAIQRHDIEWIWVKGHAGDPGNEEADALANRGIDELEEGR